MKLYNWMPGVALMAAGLSLASCDDTPNAFELTDGVPTIKFVRTTDPAAADSLITGALLDKTICLVGENLTSIREMYFNDQKAILNTSLITDHTLVVTVPGNIPAEVSNKIFMTTKDGHHVEYPFKVNVPGPAVVSFSNEYARPGETVTITGNYFIDDPNVPLTITMPGGIKVPEANITSISQSQIEFTVPEGAEEEGRIFVSTIYGEGRSNFYYHDTRGMLFDFDGMTGLDFANNCWHAQEAKADEWSLSGKYVQLGDPSVTLDDTSWGDQNFSLEYWPGDWGLGVNSFPTSGQGMLLTDLVNFSDFENMGLKFEMCIPTANPWSACAMQIIFAPYSAVQLTDANNQFFHETPDLLPRALYRPWQTTGSYDTGDKWVTVTVPFSAFSFDNEGGPSAGSLTPDHFATLTIFVWGGGISGTECNPVIKIDNIRAVPLK
ncbi:MAG: IPT/TIG domain-containing protein [Muribaculaceae bacterium]|nr:IPT/TIG domain-containing protein [Muribaculaceae bacterium]